MLRFTRAVQVNRFAISLLSVALSLSLLCGCAGTSVRETRVFKAEMVWFSSAALQQAELLQHLVPSHPDCKCNTERTLFMNPKCQKAAETLLTVIHRVPWHTAMALYNAGVRDVRPPKEPPVIPSVSVICGMVTD